MNKKTRQQLVVIALTAVYAFSALHVMTYWHEQQHVEIYESYNCTDISVEYEYFDLDPVLAKTTAFCSYDVKMPEHKELHELQENLWIVYALSVLVVELLIIKKTV